MPAAWPAPTQALQALSTSPRWLPDCPPQHRSILENPLGVVEAITGVADEQRTAEGPGGLSSTDAT